MNSKLYVGNLDWAITGKELEQFFTDAGEVISAIVVLDRDTGRSRGFGFVEMGSSEETKKAIKMFDGIAFNKRNIVVNVAKPEGDSSTPKEVLQEGEDLTDFLEKFIQKEARAGDSIGFSMGDKHFVLTRDK